MLNLVQKPTILRSKGVDMKKNKFFAASMIGFVMLSMPSYSFNLQLNRDPFMDLLKLRELRLKEQVVLQKKQISKEKEIQEKIQRVINSIVIKAVFVSKQDPKMNTALIVGPSGVPVVVYKNYKIAKDVYVSKIIKDGITLSFKTKKGMKSATLKMNKK
jgi:hypothetical protein